VDLGLSGRRAAVAAATSGLGYATAAALAAEGARVTICARGAARLEESAELVRRGIPVVTFNQRSVDEILQMIRMVGGLVGCQAAAEQLADELTSGLDQIARAAARFPRRLRVFFEEWDEPLISGIRWVEELVAIAGGAPIFPELECAGLAKDRIVDPREVARRDPEVIFASWCGKKVKKATIRSRPGWDATTAVREDRIFEIKSTYILQPGPASLTDGVRQMHAILASLQLD